MDGKVYLSDECISLTEYIESEDDLDNYVCWQDKDTQSGYKHKSTESFDEFSKRGIKSQFIATIVTLSDDAKIGSIFLSTDDTAPDLALMIYKPFRGNGYGTRAFLLGIKYCFEELNLECVTQVVIRTIQQVVKY